MRIGVPKCKQSKNDKIKKFLEKATSIYNGAYQYPSIEDEFEGMKVPIAVYCPKHDYLFFVIPSEHIYVREGRTHGRACKHCKKDKLSTIFRTPKSKIIKACKDKKLVILDGLDTYINEKDYLKVRCQNGHENRKQIVKILHTEQVCKDCNYFLGELITIKIFEKYFGVTFDKVRWPFEGFQYLELDGYNKQLSLAVEYQGQYHFNWFNRLTPNEYKKVRERDAATREMCKQREITLIEVRFFENFSETEIIKKTQSGFKNAGVIFDIGKIANIKETITQILKDNNRLTELDDICKKQNLTLVSERIYYNVEHKYEFLCNACNYKFENSIYDRRHTTSDCCPNCARKNAAPKRLASRLKNNGEKHLQDFKKKVESEHQVRVITTEWTGSGLQMFEGQCLRCNCYVHPFSYNKIQKKIKPVCLCQYKRIPPNVKNNYYTAMKKMRIDLNSPEHFFHNFR